MNKRVVPSEILPKSADTRRAIQLLQDGYTFSEVVDKLYEEGLEAEKAVTLVNRLMELPIRYAKRIGKRNILLGLLLGPGGVLLVTIRSLLNGDMLQDIILPVLVVGILGMVWSLYGLLQYLNKRPKLSQKQARELNMMAYGVEEPEKIWDCPKCHRKNPNTTYKCSHCGYDLMK